MKELEGRDLGGQSKGKVIQLYILILKRLIWLNQERAESTEILTGKSNCKQ